MNLFPVVYVLSIVAQFAFVPLFLKYYWPVKCKTSLLYKMICASLYLITAVSCMKTADNFSPFAKYMLTALIFGWFGDLFLHAISEKKAFFAIGFLSFMTGHVFFILAFMNVQKNLFPGTPVFVAGEIVAVVLIFAAFAAYAFITKMKLGVIGIAIGVYAVVISSMLVKGVSLCTRLFMAGSPQTAWSLATIGIGAILFVMSDATLAEMLFGSHKSRLLRIFNITTYFAGQVLLASSILVLR